MESDISCQVDPPRNIKVSNAKGGSYRVLHLAFLHRLRIDPKCGTHRDLNLSRLMDLFYIIIIHYDWVCTLNAFRNSEAKCNVDS